jgi:hypothetical protein
LLGDLVEHLDLICKGDIVIRELDNHLSPNKRFASNIFHIKDGTLRTLADDLANSISVLQDSVMDDCLELVASKIEDLLVFAFHMLL